MNKKELIESISHLPSDCSGPRPMIDKLTALELIKLLDEPQKVTVPQFVADYIKYAIENDWDFQDLFKCIEDEEDEKLSRWVYHERNQETLAAAWINGYTVEKEKQYYVRFKGMESDDFNYLNFIKFQHAWVLSSLKIDKKFRTEHTRKELEDAGFGWVFDCDGIEVEEVQDDSKI
jgi:hypothetical protein